MRHPSSWPSTRITPRPTRGVHIQVRDVVVDYPSERGTVHALHCPRIDVSPGTSLAVMGRSGCGKSTLLGLLAGLAVPDSGTVRIGDEVISGLSDSQRAAFRKRTVGVVYQRDNLLPHLTAEENIGLQVALCRDHCGDETFLSASAALSLLGLSRLGGRLPDHLSGGQRQRVAVARAVIHSPALLLADEPTGSLDAEAATTVMALLIDVHRRIGSTLVVVTHDPSIAARLDRTIDLPAHAG